MVTNREVEAASRTLTVRFWTGFAKYIVPLLRPLKRIPFVRSRLAGTIGGRSGTVYARLDKKEFPEAFTAAMDGATCCETPQVFGLEKMFWWTFIESAAVAATELGEGERQQVIARLASAPEPGGMMEARCLEIFSRWRWKAGDRDGAIEFARRAALADPTYAEGHLLLAWYGLMTGKFDPLPSLRRAVQASSASLEDIRANKDFARFPELLAALEKDTSP